MSTITDAQLAQLQAAVAQLATDTATLDTTTTAVNGAQSTLNNAQSALASAQSSQTAAATAVSADLTALQTMINGFISGGASPSLIEETFVSSQQKFSASPMTVSPRKLTPGQWQEILKLIQGALGLLGGVIGGGGLGGITGGAGS